MNPTTRLILRAVLPVFVVSGVLIAALFSGVVDHVRAASAADGYRTAEVTVEDQAEGTRLVLVQDSVVGAKDSRPTAAVTLPVGRPTMLAHVTGSNTVLDLAITTGEDDDIELGARSTAAALVALSPGVLSSDTGWLGTVGHLVTQAEFERLVDVVGRHDDLGSSEITEALADTLTPLRETGTDECEDACGEWLASTASVIVENVTLGRAVLVGSDKTSPRICGSVPPAMRLPGDGALIAGSAAVVGRTTSVELDPAPAVDPSLTRIDAAGCDREVWIVTAGAGNAAERQAAWAGLLADYALPLVDLISGQRTGLSPEALDALAASALERSIEPSVPAALDLVMADAELSDIQATLIDAVTEVVGNGLFAGGGTEGSRRQVVDAPEPPPVAEPDTPAPVESVPDAPSPTVPVAAAPVVGGALTTSYQTGQPQGAFEVTVTATNTGETVIDLAATSWRLAGPGGTIAPAGLPASLGKGTLAPGASQQGVMRFALKGAAGSYRLEWVLPAGLIVSADL